MVDQTGYNPISLFKLQLINLNSYEEFWVLNLIISWKSCISVTKDVSMTRISPASNGGAVMMKVWPTFGKLAHFPSILFVLNPPLLALIFSSLIFMLPLQGLYQTPH